VKAEGNTFLLVVFVAWLSSAVTSMMWQLVTSSHCVFIPIAYMIVYLTGGVALKYLHDK